MTLPDTSSLDVVFLACRPVELSDMEKRAQTEAGVDIGRPYSDSIQGTCQGCDRAVWLGPRQAAMLAANKEKALVVCVSCAVAFTLETGASPQELEGLVQDLGNPETP